MILIKIVDPQTRSVDTYEMSREEEEESECLLSRLKTLKDPITVHSVFTSKEDKDFCEVYFNFLRNDKYATHLCIYVEFEFYFELGRMPTTARVYFAVGGDSITQVDVPKEFDAESFIQTIETRLCMDHGGNEAYGFIVHDVDEHSNQISFVTDDWEYQFMVFREFLYESQVYPHTLVDHRETVSKSSLN